MSDEKNLLQQRSIQQSIGQNFANSKELQEHNLNSKTFAETRNFTTDHRFSTKTSDLTVENPNERRSFDSTD